MVRDVLACFCPRNALSPATRAIRARFAHISPIIAIFAIKKNTAVHYHSSLYALCLLAAVFLASCSRENVTPGEVPGAANGAVVNLDSVTTTSDGVTAVNGVPTFRLHDGQVVTGSLVRTDNAHRVKLTIEDGATVTLSDVTIDGKTESNTNTPWAGITCEGSAIILLAGSCTVTNFDPSFPAIYVPTDATLTLDGTGSLTAKNTFYDSTGCGAAIGGGYELPGGNIVISGGTIWAQGGIWSAAIGGGGFSTCGNIVITGGSVTATSDGAGIGSGEDGSCGNITITDGTVTATGGENAAGIGTCTNSRCGNITITGGTVRAQGGNSGAGIGCGWGEEELESVCGDITIKSSDDIYVFLSVTAIKGPDAFRPIGHSSSDNEKNTCGTIQFGFSTVYRAGDAPYSYNPGSDDLRFEVTTTDLGDPDKDYLENTWVLTF